MARLPESSVPSSARKAAPAVRPASRVPARRQLSAQLAADLRAGRWRSGERLPGVRDLAERAGVHRETARAAYRELAEDGLVRVRPGSGVYAAGRSPRPEGLRYRSDPALVGRALRGFLARERAAGRSADELAGLLGRWREAVDGRRVVVVERDPDLLSVWTAEVREALAPAGLEVEGIPLARARAEPDRLAAGLVLAGPAGRPEVAGLAPAWTEVLALRPGPSPRVRKLLRRVPAGTVLAAVSRSGRLVAEVRALAAGLRGGDVAVAAADPGDPARLRRRVRVARFVLVDVTCREALAGRVPGVRRLVLRHLSPEELATLGRWLERRPPAGDGSGPGTGRSGAPSSRSAIRPTSSRSDRRRHP